MQRRKGGRGDFELVWETVCGHPRVPMKAGSQTLQLLCAFAPLRLCVNKSPASFRFGILLVLLVLLDAGCATKPRRQISTPANLFPAEALITQRGVLTVLGRQFTLNGYLACSATKGRRLIVTENFGNVLADVLIKPTGEAFVMRSSRAFKPRWIHDYLAADVRCIFGGGAGKDCPRSQLSPTHFEINRRWYKLDLKIVEVKPGPQPAEMFEPPQPERSAAVPAAAARTAP